MCVCVCVCEAYERVKVTHHYSIAGRQNRVIAGKKGLVGCSIATRSRESGWGNWNSMGGGVAVAVGVAVGIIHMYEIIYYRNVISVILTN